MKSRSAAIALAALAAGSLALPSHAAPRKQAPFKKTVSYTDQTPDPTGSTTADTGCGSAMPSQYPVEAGIPVKITYPGKIKASLDNKLDWALEIRDPKGNVLSSSDGGGPTDPESTSAKAKKPGTYVIYPCNLTGEPTVNVSYSYTPS